MFPGRVVERSTTRFDLRKRCRTRDRGPARYRHGVTSPLCVWPADRSCLPEPDTDADALRTDHAVELAAAVIWALSGRQYGLCPETVRPCPDTGRCYGWGPGVKWTANSCACGARCERVGPNVLHLPHRRARPIRSIESVTIEGVDLDPSEYALEGDALYRRGAAWPTQRLDRPLGDPGTWSVTYLAGTEPPAGVGTLTGQLAREFLAACTSGKCRLPRRVRAVTRQGVSYDMVDPTDIYSTGKTGIPEIDLWLSAVNPHALQAPPEVR